MDLLSRRRIDLNAFVLNRMLFWLDEIREIEIELPLSWAHEQFATRVGTLFYIFNMYAV